jgi:hypothetical protein
MINADEFNLHQSALSVYAHRVTCSAEFMEILSKFQKAGVSLDIYERVIPVINQPMMLELINITASVLVDEIAKGLPVNHIKIELLTDIDAGRWEEIVFNVQVKLNSSKANAAWDKVLQRIFEITEEKGDRDLMAALYEKIGIHFTWITSNCV